MTYGELDEVFAKLAESMEEAFGPDIRAEFSEGRLFVTIGQTEAIFGSEGELLGASCKKFPKKS